VSFERYSESRVSQINEFLFNSLHKYRQSTSQRFTLLIDAMEYSLAGGGKRLRPLLVVASAEALGVAAEHVLPAAAAIEYVHTYSLIHDDLPALDDDDTRRGKPSSHKKYGEAVAILTGDALLTEAFCQLAQTAHTGAFSAAHIPRAIELLCQYAGVRGMVGGQLLDVTTNPDSYNLPEVEFIHIHKTGAMILASVMLPCLLKGLEAEKNPEYQHFRRYGEALGLAFQISDDILDAEAQFRYSRGPRKKPKPTYANLMTQSEMRERLQRLTDVAIESIQSLGDKSQALVDIANFVRTRKS
jgi:geranylgeranyl diphosphate synthase, type II